MGKRITFILLITMLCTGMIFASENTKTSYLADSLTKITPHMETEIEDGLNVIYCASFQLAWNSLQNNIVKGDVLLENNQEFADYLNKQLFTEDDISKDSYVAVSGSLTDHMVTKINQMLEEKFGAFAPVFEANNWRGGLFSYAFLYKGINFKQEFERALKPIVFDELGEKKAVRAFGISQGVNPLLREQVIVHDYVDKDDFIIELKSTSENEQLILAKVKPQSTLLQTIEMVDQRISNKIDLGLGRNEVDFMRQRETLKIPIVEFDLQHSYSELEGNFLINGGMIQKAEQSISFHLNEQGVTLKSEAKIGLISLPRSYVFDKPFLIFIKQKEARYPYLAIWIGNSDLLVSE